jgi:hypothetical protein
MRAVTFAAVSLLLLTACRGRAGEPATQRTATDAEQASAEPNDKAEPKPEPQLQLPSADSLEAYGVPAPPSEWPTPVPTLYADKAVSLRGLSFTMNDYGNQTIVVRAIVRSIPAEKLCHATGCGNELRLVDRMIDEPHTEFPALLSSGALPEVGSRVLLLAKLLADDHFLPTLEVIAVAPDPDPITQDREPSWQPVPGAPTPLPEPREPPALLIEGSGALPLELASNADEAMELVQVAALADHGQLAELHARRAVSLAPTNPEAWSLLAAIYGGYAHFEHQLAVLAAGSKQCPEALDLWFQWGQRAVEAGKFSDAIAPLEHVLDKQPDSLAASFYLGTALWLDGKREQARPHYERVIAIHERTPVHLANEFEMIMTAENRLAELGKGHDH